MKTRCFQDMLEEEELDGEYEPLDVCPNPSCYFSVSCLMFANIHGSLCNLQFIEANNENSVQDDRDPNFGNEKLSDEIKINFNTYDNKT